MRNVTEIQQRLIALGYLRPGEDDGKFGAISLDAYNHWRASKGAGPVNNASVTQLNIDLFPEEQPGAKPRLTPNPLVQAIVRMGLKFLLGRLSGLTIMAPSRTARIAVLAALAIAALTIGLLAGFALQRAIFG